MASVGGYKFVAETPILRPRIDRPLYFLVYATRHKAGIEVFRNAQMKTLIEQELRRDDIRQGQFSGAQIDMFRPNEMSPSEAATTRDTERVSATEALLELVSSSHRPQLYDDLWPIILSQHGVTKTDLNQIVAKLRRDGLIRVPEWQPKARVPAGAWRIFQV